MTDIQQVVSFISDPELLSLTCKYDENLQKRKVDIGLNIFAIISPVFHYENFHSDIIKILIDPNGPHRQGRKYLDLFLAFIRNKRKDLNINPSDYRNVEVTREQGRIDLLIRDEETKKAIFIENKINGAGDMHRQIPRYLDYLNEHQETECDGILYLTLNKFKLPDLSDWSEKEKQIVMEKLVSVSAYDEQPHDLYTGWICKCLDASEKYSDVYFLIKQYADLIKYLGGNVMNKPIMEKFLEKMVDKQNYKTARLLNEMLSNLESYRADKITDEFRDDPSPFPQKPTTDPREGYVGFWGLDIGGASFGIAIAPYPDCYEFSFKDNADQENIKGHAEDMLKKMNCFADFKWNPDCSHFEKRFDFPEQENEIIPFIRSFKNKLREVTSVS